MHTPLDFMSLFYIHTEMSGEGTESGHKYEKELEFWLSSAPRHIYIRRHTPIRKIDAHISSLQIPPGKGLRPTS